MVVVGVRDSDTDDAEPLRIKRLRPVVRPTLELRFDSHVDVRLGEVTNHILDLLALQGMARPRYLRNSSVIIGFAFFFNRLTK